MENAWKGTPYYKDWLYLRNGTMFWTMRKFLPQTNEKYYSDIRITATTKSIQHQKQKNPGAKCYFADYCWKLTHYSTELKPGRH